MALIVLFVDGAALDRRLSASTAARNPTPASFTHNTKIEIAWTLIPVLILIVIGSFSLPILFKQLEVPTPDLTIKATGNQWYWTYDYPDNDVQLRQPDADRATISRARLSAGDLTCSPTDTARGGAGGRGGRLQVTGADVIHSWTMPAFGVKMDAVPGRLNETWFQAEEEGIYFGQCSELCGKDHSYMPITVKVVSQEDYDAWLDWAIDEYGGTRGPRAPAAPARGAAATACAPSAVPPRRRCARPTAR